MSQSSPGTTDFGQFCQKIEAMSRRELLEYASSIGYDCRYWMTQRMTDERIRKQLIRGAEHRYDPQTGMLK